MKVVLSIAGSDSGGGAGIQADLKTFEYFGVFGVSALSVLTAQNTCSVDSIFEVDASFVKAQIDSIVEDFELSAIKIGMLYSAEIIEAVKELLERRCGDIPIVLDTVAVTNSGDLLLQENALNALKEFIPSARLITPNRRELKLLLGIKNEVNEKYIYQNCFEMRDALKSDIYAKNFIDGELSVDYLITKEGIERIESQRVESKNTHGTGCTLSSAIAANLALGKNLKEACLSAKRYVSSAIASAPNLGKCGGPIRHNLLSK